MGSTLACLHNFHSLLGVTAVTGEAQDSSTESCFTVAKRRIGFVRLFSPCLIGVPSGTSARFYTSLPDRKVVEH